MTARESTRRAGQLTLLLAEASPLGKTAPNRVLDIVLSIQRIERGLHRIAERQCNGYQTWDHKWDQPAADRDKVREERLEKRLAALVAELGGEITATTEGDPRGCAIHLHIPGKPGDGWEDGYAVY